MSALERAEQLRRTFRSAFGAAHSPQEACEKLLAIRIGGDPYAVRLEEVAALHADRKVVALPSPFPELLGLAAFRGSIAPVYALGPWLGYPSTPLPRWLMLAGESQPVWLAVDLFEGQLRSSAEDLTGEAPGKGSGRAHLRGAVRTADAVRPIVHLASVLEAIALRIHTLSPRSVDRC